MRNFAALFLVLLLFSENSYSAATRTIDASAIRNGAATVTVPTTTTTIVGTGTTDVLTNKDIDGGTAANNRRITLPKGAKASLDALTRKQGTILYATDAAKAYVDDGSSLLPIGSNSGSNYNFMVNGGFEDAAPSINWALAGSVTLPVVSTDRVEGFQSLGLTLTATTGAVMEQSYTPPASLLGVNIEHTIRVKTASTTVQACLLYNGFEYECAAIVGNSTWQTYTFNRAGSAAGSIGLRIKTTGSTTGTILVDDAYVGAARNVGTVQTSYVVGKITWAGIAACNWTAGAVSGVWSNFSVDTDCSTPTVTGNIAAPATKIPQFTIVSGAPGTYVFRTTLAFSASVAGSSAAIRFSDGTNFSDSSRLTQNGAGVTLAMPGVSASLTFASAFTNKVIDVQGLGITSSAIATLPCDNVVFTCSIEVLYFPSQAQTVVAANQSNYGMTDYTPTLTNMTGTPAGCFHKRDGEFLIIDCKMSFTAGAAAVAQLSLPTGLAASALKVPSIRKVGECQISAAGGSTAVASVWTMLIDASQTAFRFGFRDASFGGFVTRDGNGLIAGALSASCQARVPIEGWTENQKASALVNGVLSSSAGTERIERLKITPACTSSPCTITSQSGGFTGVTRSSTGLYPLAFTAFSSAPTCVCTTGGPFRICGVNTVTASSATLSIGNGAGSFFDDAFDVICMGPR